MRIEVLDAAQDDLVAGFQFYEEQSPGLGAYFLDSLFADIDSLLLVCRNSPGALWFASVRSEPVSVCDLLPNRR
jgi:hypothetical protein